MEVNSPTSTNPMLTFLTSTISIASFIVSNITKSNLAWGVGFVAGCIAVVSGIMTIREKHLSIKKLKKEIHNLKK